MHAHEAHRRRDELQLLDVREPSEWTAGHVEGATHVPMGELGRRLDEVASDRRVVCVCRVGARSQAVADALDRLGYDAVNLDGGLIAWQAAGLPLVSPDGAPGTVI